jgi:hypothetical protein
MKTYAHMFKQTNTMWFVLVLPTALGYFVWDGFVPRKLGDSEVTGGAQLKTSGWVEFHLYPVDESRKYIAVYLNNPSDYIIRGVTVSAQIKVKPNTIINVPNTPCIGPRSELRVLARTTAHRQTCIVTLSAEHSRLIPEMDKTIDRDALEFHWWLTSVEGHAQPIKILQDR